MNTLINDQATDFKSQLIAYKQRIDADILQYAKELKESTQRNYGARSLVAVDPYCAILQAGGKRIRGMLTIVGYEMMQGKDSEMILKAARAVEMMHAYILVIDDVQDRSHLRRGGPTAHRIVAQAHKDHGWLNDSDHFGEALALNGALIGAHSANFILANLDVSQENRLKAVSIMNHTMVVTAQGQTNDILNEIANDVTKETIENVLQWKTAHYSVLNPIHMGMVLAGAPCEDTNAITEYALNVGKAFQIADDLLIMSTDGTAGKDALDDIREGKQTLLTLHALEHASPEDAEFLRSCLGNEHVTQAQFNRCKAIFDGTGAVEYARGLANEHITIALNSLEQHKDRWNPKSVQFLRQLATYVVTRKN